MISPPPCFTCVRVPSQAWARTVVPMCTHGSCVHTLLSSRVNACAADCCAWCACVLCVCGCVCVFFFCRLCGHGDMPNIPFLPMCLHQLLPDLLPRNRVRPTTNATSATSATNTTTTTTVPTNSSYTSLSPQPSSYTPVSHCYNRHRKRHCCAVKRYHDQQQA